MLQERRTTNILLLIIAVPVMFIILKQLAFIFVPLFSSMFIALLFLPIMRWLNKRNVPKYVSVVIVLLIVFAAIKLGVELIQLTSREIVATKDGFLQNASVKLHQFTDYLETVFGLNVQINRNTFEEYIGQGSIATTLGVINNVLTRALMTTFFVVLWLVESINIQKLMNQTILKQERTSIKTFIKIEKDLITFIKVKFSVSLFTGIGIGLACYFFGVSFPLFWGLFAFLINFVQMVGSFISVILLAFFAFVEMDVYSTLLFFILTITAVQVLFGAILEPIFMGKSFSINVIAILIMLMFWGYIWGIAGLIMAIPITVFIKIIAEQFESTKIIATLLNGKKSTKNPLNITAK